MSRSSKRTIADRKRESSSKDWDVVCSALGLPDRLSQYLCDIDIDDLRNQDEKQQGMEITLALGKFTPRIDKTTVFEYSSSICQHLKGKCFDDSIYTSSFGQQTEVPAMLFSLGIRPFKIEVNVPDRVRLRPNVVNSACCKQGVTPLPEYLVDGYFEYVHEKDGTKIYIYEFKTRRGCRAIDTDVHGAFPPTSNHMIEDAELLRYRTTNVAGLGYLVNEGSGDELQDVKVLQDGKIWSAYVYAGKERNELACNEKTVQDRIISHLNEKVLDETCTACRTSKSECKSSQFSGGGDIEFHCVDDNAVLTLGGGQGEVNNDEEELEQSPIYLDEVRAGSNIELKHKPKEEEKHIELQLRANMFLCLSRQLEKILNKYSLDELKSLNTMCIYGLTFGYRSILLLLKLTVNFCERTTGTIVRYRSSESLSWAIEASTAYIIAKMRAKMRAKSVASVTPSATPSTTPTPPPPD